MIAVFCVIAVYGLHRLTPALSSMPLLLLIRVTAVALLLIAAGIVSGLIYHRFRLRRFLNEYPPPGRLLNVGAFRMHILAEGEQRELPGIIWIPGSHDAGIAMAPFHNAFRDKTRSVLYDRAGSGWSDNGSFPRTVVREVDELARLLDKAGEKGPFVIVAHSLGGLIATNFAYKYPEKLAGLILLDIACPDLNAYTANLPGSKTIGDGRLLPWLAVLGVLWHRHAPGGRASVYSDEERKILDGFHAQVKTHANFISALNAVAADPLGTVSTPGILGDMPLVSIIPKIDAAEHNNELRPHVPYMTEFQLANLVAITAAARLRTAQLSRCGESRYSPESTGHNFLAEAPDFVIAEVTEMLQALSSLKCRS